MQSDVYHPNLYTIDHNFTHCLHLTCENFRKWKYKLSLIWIICYMFTYVSLPL